MLNYKTNTLRPRKIIHFTARSVFASFHDALRRLNTNWSINFPRVRFSSARVEKTKEILVENKWKSGSENTRNSDIIIKSSVVLSVDENSNESLKICLHLLLCAVESGNFESCLNEDYTYESELENFQFCISRELQGIFKLLHEQMRIMISFSAYWE